MAKRSRRTNSRDRKDPTAVAVEPAVLVSASGLVASAGASGALAVGMIPEGGGSLSIPVAELLTNVIEGYAFGDLESIKTEITPKPFGAGGYLMVAAVFAGSELLGAISSAARNPGSRVDSYWSGYMARIDERYGYLGKLAKQLLRDGVAHLYLSHSGVAVVRGAPERHLRICNGELIFDCIQLYEDFRRSYEEHAKADILQDVALAQRRLDKLMVHEREKARLVAELPADVFLRFETLPTSCLPTSGIYSRDPPEAG